MTRKDDPMDKDKDKETPRDKAIGTVLAEIDKQFGKGAIMRLGADEARPEVPVVSTGSLGLDIALGTGGLPRGRIVEVYGPESSGKTTLALHVLAEAQRAGGVCAFIDAEHALDIGYARKLGVKAEDLLLSQPDCGEQALEICDMLVRSEAIDVIVIDSVAALVPKAELEGEMGDSHMGLQARLMSQALRKLTGACARGKTLVLFINQLRMKIGVMFGNPETTTGGNALKFYASVRLDVRRIGALKDGEQVVGNRTRVKVVKNKLAAPFRETEFDVGYGQGISRAGEIIDLGVEAGLLEKSGAWIGYGGERLGNGREAARQHLCEHQELLREIRGKLLARAGIGAAALAASAANGMSAASVGGGSGGVAGGASVTGAAASVAPAPRVVAPVAARKVA
jgi:recombination protein RecA